MKSLKTLLALSLPALALALPGPTDLVQTGRAGQESPPQQGDAGDETGGQDGDGAPPAGPPRAAGSTSSVAARVRVRPRQRTG